MQKYTTLAYAQGLESGLGGLRHCICRHSKHSEVAHGRDAYGRGRAELAAASGRHEEALSAAVAREKAVQLRALEMAVRKMRGRTASRALAGWQSHATTAVRLRRVLARVRLLRCR